jgi:arsenate reductase
VKAAGGKQRILFLCIGNSCRSQMAEGFAKAYGSDVLEIHSAGLAPAPGIAPLTKYVMGLRNVRIDETHFPKGLELVLHQPFDIIVNMTGQPVNLSAGRVLDWPVRDPIGQLEPVYREVAAQIEDLVMRLILEVRG